MQTDMFTVAVPEKDEPLILHLGRIRAPRRMGKERAKDAEPLRDNFHIPSFKNSKVTITQAHGRALKRPMVITAPEYQEWKTKAVQSLESQLLSKCQTVAGEIQLERSKLFAMLSRLPEDDSVNDLREGSWKVVRVPPGEEGATIVIERL